MGLTFGLASTKISFGLYEGHLPIDHASYTKYQPYSNFLSSSLTLLALVFFNPYQAFTTLNICLGVPYRKSVRDLLC
jgi:hypothetical protein